MSKKAFTLSEVMVTLTIMGVLAAILIPTISRVMPNQNKTMFKKSYSTMTKIVSELINDEGLYPEDATLQGFLNTNTATIGSGEVVGGPKFCTLVADQLNLSGTADCTGSGTFQTNDGMTWTIPVDAFTNAAIPTAIVTVDVNGPTAKPGRSPNCMFNASTCPKPDQFQMVIRNDGKFTLTGKEAEYIQDNTVQ